MVWGGMNYQERYELKIIDGNLNATKYRDEIIQLFSRFLQRHRFNHVFQKDNDRCHVAQISMNFLENNHIRVWPRLAMSPDLSPIEHLWDELARRFIKSQNPPETLAQHRTALLVEWNNIPQDFI